MSREDSAFNLFKLMFQAHPWHGVTPGAEAPETVNAYIEIVPTDAVKYELDKQSGHLHVRSQKSEIRDQRSEVRSRSQRSKPDM